MRISNRKLFIDLKYFSSGCHSLVSTCEGMDHEFWKNNICTDNGLPADIRIPTVRRTIRGKFIIIASTEGNTTIPEKENIKIGLNVYKNK